MLGASDAELADDDVALDDDALEENATMTENDEEDVGAPEDADEVADGEVEDVIALEMKDGSDEDAEVDWTDAEETVDDVTDVDTVEEEPVLSTEAVEDDCDEDAVLDDVVTEEEVEVEEEVFEEIELDVTELEVRAAESEDVADEEEALLDTACDELDASESVEGNGEAVCPVLADDVGSKSLMFALAATSRGSG